MIEINSNEALMVYLINQLGEAYPDNAVLKGGMVLRLLNCPRYTNDLDYVFVPFKSKKEILPLLKETLKNLKGAKLTYSMHSTSLRIQIKYKDFQTQIEANVNQDCKTEPLSTEAMATPNNQLARIIRVMSFDVMLAHKLAAWNERNLVRDLYDAYFMFSYLDVLPDRQTLQTRLEKITYRHKNKKNQPKKMAFNDFGAKLNNALKQLNQQDIDSELKDTLSPVQRAGLDKKIKMELRSMIEKLTD